MTIQRILLCIILRYCSTTANITELGIPKIFPIIPHTGQIVNHRSSRIPLISFRYSQPKENFKKNAKIEEKYDQLVRIVGNTQQSNPIFIKLINKNLSKGYAIDQPIYPIHLNLNNNEELQLNQLNRWNLSIPKSQLNDKADEEMDRENEIRQSKKLEMMEPSCIFNSKKQKYAIIKEYLHFWNLSLESIDLDHNFSDIMHISMINRKCSTDQKATFCCEQITKSLNNSANNDRKVCDNDSSLISTKCYEFCINLENGNFINSTEYPCQEDYNSSFSKFVDRIQTFIYNKTNAIIIGQNENAKNPEFQIWAQQILQKLDIAFALNNQNSSRAALEEETRDTIFSNQWIELSKFNEITIIDHELAWQLLKEYQQYDENISNNLIRICITNQNMAQIICTEQYYYNICHFDDSNECIDDIFTAQTSAICRRFKIEDAKIVGITELFCDSLNESFIFWYYQHKASQSTTGIIILQLIRTTIIHSIPATTTTINELDQYETSENVVEKRYKYENHMQMKIDKQSENIFETSISNASKIAENSTEFMEADNNTFTMADSITTQMFSDIEETNLTMSTNLSNFVTTTLERINMISNTTLTNPLEILQDLDDISNDTTTDMMTNLNDINATVETQSQNTDG
ncbi:tRNA-2-methylthio-N(6)-dimethylallyladenosine synthase [Dirofilaria immitis]